MGSAKIQNANIIYDFLITEQNHTNVKLSTRLSYIKMICLFNRYLSCRIFTKIATNNNIDYLNSLKRSESHDPTHLKKFFDILF
jgi:predicted component of type VI protein secretion system